jgi:aminopeptidase N
LPKNILEIDFKGDAREVLVNGEKVETNASEGFEYLKITKSHLKLGVNKVAVVYRNKYDNDAYGCISSLNEGKQYLYTTFEPHSAHRVFPVFDQPDLKATFNFFIIVPDHWVAVSNEPHSHQDFLDLSSYETHTSVDHNHKALVNRYLEDQKGKLLVFPKNRRISTYLFSFIAGEYFEIALPVEKRHNNIPMSLYALDSYKDVLDNHKDFIF